MSGTSRERADWLEEALTILRRRFTRLGYTVPANVRVSFGWPRGSHGKGRAIGQCWSAVASTDGHNEIFISPELGVPANVSEDEKVARSCRILDVLAHELVHATVGVEASHGPVFKQCAEKIGLTGKMTATVASDDFNRWAATIIAGIGTFPGGGLTEAGRRKQTTRLLKCSCPACGYTARVTNKWICDAGAPICPADDKTMEVAA